MTPNRRGRRSREIVLDAAEHLMATRGYDAATMSAIVSEAGIPASSVYHYFGSKNAVLLAVMERGAERFYDAIPRVEERLEGPDEHLAVLVRDVTATLERQPDFLRLLVVLATQPPTDDELEVHAVVNRVRNRALRRLRVQMALAFEIDPDGAVADRLARFSLAVFDGAFVATQADSGVSLRAIVESLPEALLAIARQYERAPAGGPA